MSHWLKIFPLAILQLQSSCCRRKKRQARAWLARFACCSTLRYFWRSRTRSVSIISKSRERRFQRIFTFRLPDVGGTICAPLAACMSARPLLRIREQDKRYSLRDRRTVSLPIRSCSSSSSASIFFLSMFVAKPASSAFLVCFGNATPTPAPSLIGCIMFVMLTIPPVGGAVIDIAASPGPAAVLPDRPPSKARSSVVDGATEPSSPMIKLESGRTSIAPAPSWVYAHHAPSGESMLSLPIPPFREARRRN